jgi:hypothetical protein
MLVDSECVGDWMASTYRPDGIRTDHVLSLRPDGGFVWRSRRDGPGEDCSRGAWRHDRRERALYFTPSEPGPGYGPDRPQLWRVMEIAGLEGTNTIMVLRWVALAARNLPVLFYRVHVRAAELQSAPDTGRRSC